MRLEIRGGGFGYGGGFLFRDVNLDIDDNRILAVLGPNGAGKTTFLKCIMNMMPWKEGGAFIDGADIRTIPVKAFAKTVAYVPQAKNYAFDRSAIEMVVLGRSPYLSVFEEPKRSDVETAERSMERLGISALADRSCRKLSGGELQMVLIARALASEPKLLILDEPESNLDYRNQLKILNTIHELSEDAICIMNTHYPGHALRIADDALILTGDGRSVWGKADEVLTEENIGITFGVDTVIGSVNTPTGEIRYVLPTALRE
jgi:iron complex transport system ATP-binding protein